MQIRELKVPGAWELTPTQFDDDRGTFLEWFQGEQFEAVTGRTLEVAQANLSVSNAGVLRGIHYADVPPGQAKYVTCARGSVFDVVVDIRVGSPTFGEWDAVLLDDVDRRAVFLSEGLGHGFLSLEDDSTVLYMCSTAYAQDREHGITPLDSQIGIEWPTQGSDGRALTYRLSDKDRDAQSLAEAGAQGVLPVLF